MKVTKTSISFAWLMLAFYALYAVFGIGFNGLLFSIAVGLITFSMNDNMVIVAAATIVAGILWRTVISPRVMDAFVDVIVSKGADGKAAFPESRVAEIVKRVIGMEGGVEGVGSAFAEGFADAGALDQPRPDAGSAAAEKKDAVATGSSKPAGTGDATVSKEMAASAPNSDAAGAIKDASADKAVETANKDLPKIGVQKGAVPDDKKGAAGDNFYVDAPSTLMKAIEGLKGSQIEAMTSDTRALLETQKSLMGMLQTMKPLLSDSQEMMSTFQGMFGTGAK
jgi:hypothetical protein